MADRAKGSWPESVRVGVHDVAFTFSVLADPITGNEFRGDFTPLPPQIRINSSLAGPPLVEVIVHELLHAIWWAHGVSTLPNDQDADTVLPGLTEESLVARLGAAYSLLWVSNPMLFQAISREARRGHFS